jgi:hypothetical protein
MEDQKVTQTIFGQNEYIIYNYEIVTYVQILGYFCNVQKSCTKSKQSPIGRKLVQSGHPA